MKLGFPGGSVIMPMQELQGSIPGLEKSPGGGNGNPLQYSCLGNPTDRGAWWVTVHGVAESDTTTLPTSYEVGLVLATCHTQKTMIFSQKKNKKPMLIR